MVIAHRMITRSQGTVSTRNLIDITIGSKQSQRLFGLLQIAGMVSQRLQRLCLKIRIVAALGNVQTARQTLYLVSTNLLSAAIRQDATSTDVIQIVQILSGIASRCLRVHCLDSLYRLTLQTHIIIIGGIDDSHL